MKPLKSIWISTFGKAKSSYRSRTSKTRRPEPTLLDLQGALGRLSEEELSEEESSADISSLPEKYHYDSSWIDISVLRLWLGTCDAEHYQECKRLQRETAILGLPNYLVDTEEACIVIAEPDHQYAALSYVWGQVQTLQTTMASLEELMRPKALLDSRHRVARTIEHTMQLVKLLEIRYLWVDSLCIVQDDEETKSAQLQQMAGIYANAYVTVIAAVSWDANHGLRGIRGVTDSRSLPPDASDFLDSKIRDSIWYSRGWTLQEEMFSRRRIYFQYQTVTWQCDECMWHELTGVQDDGVKLVERSRDRGDSKQGGLIASSELPDAVEYLQMVKRYNTRSLTFPEDIHRAITSLLSFWSRSSFGGFLGALPITFFDQALLWQPKEPLRRRISKHSNEHLPSWSWIGWEGDIDIELWKEQWDHVVPYNEMKDSHRRTEPEAQWYYLDSKNNRMPVMPGDGHGFLEESARNSSVGRKQHERPEFGQTRATFTHERSGTHGLSTSSDVDENESSFASAETGSFLYCTTRRAFIRQGDLVRENSLNFSKGNHYMFVMRLDQDFELSNGQGWFTIAPSSDISAFELLELVSISAGREEVGRYSVAHQYLQIKEGAVFNYFNVMWIERRDGVAYRKAVGCVEASVWNEIAREKIDLVLG